MFGRADPTDYDLRFSLFGIPVRVHPYFWLTSVFLVLNSADSRLERLVVGVLSVFVAVLVHELGHALTARYFGHRPEIVLESFGGYATVGYHDRMKQILITAAGPGAGLAMYGLQYLAVDPLREAGFFRVELAAYAYGILMMMNWIWSLFNLLPVIPLDGGQICREICCGRDKYKGMLRAHLISFVTAGVIGVLALQALMRKTGFYGFDPLFTVMMFGFLGFQNYQAYEQLKRGSW